MATPIRETIARVYVETANGKPDPEWAEHWQWYLDGAGNPNSCVHYSVHGRGAQHADAVLRALDEAGCVVVPKEPTEAMRLAAVEAMGEQERAVRTRAGPADTSFKRGIDSGAIMACNSVNTDAAYRAMISASVVE